MQADDNSQPIVLFPDTDEDGSIPEIRTPVGSESSGENVDIKLKKKRQRKPVDPDAPKRSRTKKDLKIEIPVPVDMQFTQCREDDKDNANYRDLLVLIKKDIEELLNK
jgi:hypothetical protein